MDGYVAKPIVADELYHAVDEILPPIANPDEDDPPRSDKANLSAPEGLDEAVGIIDWSTA
jgi:hypothetical protein